MDYTNLMDAIRPAMTDVLTGDDAPTDLWHGTALTVGGVDEPILHAFGVKAEQEEETTWTATVLTKSRIIRCVGKANFANWGANGRPDRSSDVTAVRADARPLSAVRSCTITDVRPLRNDSMRDVVGRYEFEIEGARALVIDVTAVRNLAPRAQLEAAAEFLLTKVGGQ